MFYRKNIHAWEQWMRVVASLGVAAYALYAFPGALPGYAIVASAVGFALTGLVGWCPMCAMVGRKIEAAGD
jgi:hypothetical protein